MTSQLEQLRRAHLAAFAADFPTWTVFTTGGPHVGGYRWNAVPLPAGTPLGRALRVRSGLVRGDTATALRATLTALPTAPPPGKAPPTP